MIVKPNVFILSTALMTSIEIFINGQSSKIKRKGLGSVYSLKDNCFLSGYHADTPITIKAEVILKADSRSH